MSGDGVNIRGVIAAIILLYVLIAIVWQSFGAIIVSALVILGKVALVLVVVVVVIYIIYEYFLDSDYEIQREEGDHLQSDFQDPKDDNIHKVLQAIEEFAPPRRYDTEDKYRDTLFSWLKSRFPNTKIEYQIHASRPDIVVDIDSTQIAIEIKGPTTSRDLQTIADKIIRYRQYFDKIIIILFDVKVSGKRYREWLNGIQNNFYDVVIIEKRLETGNN